MIFTIVYIRFFITLTTHVFLHFLMSKFISIQYYKKNFIFLLYFYSSMLIYLLTNSLFASSLLLLNSFHSIVNLISRISKKIYIVYRHAAKASNRIAFFLLIKIFNRYKISNSSVYNYVFTIELEFF